MGRNPDLLILGPRYVTRNSVGHLTSFHVGSAKCLKKRDKVGMCSTTCKATVSWFLGWGIDRWAKKSCGGKKIGKDFAGIVACGSFFLPDRLLLENSLWKICHPRNQLTVAYDLYDKIQKVGSASVIVGRNQLWVWPEWVQVYPALGLKL